MRESDLVKYWTPWSVRHLFHLVTPSPWPIIMSFSIFLTVIGGTTYFHGYQSGLFLITFGLIMILSGMFVWFRDIIREGVQGHHTLIVQKGLRYGVILFILSEVMFFFGIFWACFHSSLVPTIEIGSIWPPKEIELFNPYHIPLLNTAILLTSGMSITFAHNELASHLYKESDYINIISYLGLTIWLAVVFTSLQIIEYMVAAFTISDSIYGSTFYFATGFHGLHVIIGTVFILVCAFRFYYKHFTPTNHIGLEAAAWYWHFVDVVWLILYISLYLNLIESWDSLSQIFNQIMKTIWVFIFWGTIKILVIITFFRIEVILLFSVAKWIIRGLIESLTIIVTTTIVGAITGILLFISLIFISIILYNNDRNKN